MRFDTRNGLPPAPMRSEHSIRYLLYSVDNEVAFLQASVGAAQCVQQVPYRKKGKYSGILGSVWEPKIMRHDAAFLQSLHNALRQAARDLQNLKLVKPDSDAEVRRLMEELRAVVPMDETERETSSAI